MHVSKSEIDADCPPAESGASDLSTPLALPACAPLSLSHRLPQLSRSLYYTTMSLRSCCMSGYKVRRSSSPHSSVPAPSLDADFPVVLLQHDGTPFGKIEQLGGVRTCASLSPELGAELSLTTRTVQT